MMSGDMSAHLQNALHDEYVAVVLTDITKEKSVNQFHEISRYVPHETVLQETRPNSFTSPFSNS
jgi:hypothetical protein